MDEPIDGMQPTQLRDMVIGSMDTLTGAEINLTTPSTWNDQPPLLQGYDRRGNPVEETEILLKGMLRQGIPPALRCAVQLSNVVLAVHPHQEADYSHEYRTLAKVRALDSAYDTLLQRVLGNSKKKGDRDTEPSKFAQPTSAKFNDLWNSMEASKYGRIRDNDIFKLLPDAGVTEEGALAWKRVLIALEQMLGVAEYAPLIPVLAAVLLCSMSESYAFCAIREMGHAVAWYFPVSRSEHAAWCGAFTMVMKKLHPATAEYLEDRGILDSVEGLSPIFKDFFVEILPLKCVLRIMDLYTLEGFKVIFRFGVSLLVMYKKVIFEQLVTISNADEWWNTMKLWANSGSKRFDFELLVRKAYGLQGTGIRRQLRFPGRSILQRLIRMEEERIRADALLDDDGAYQEPAARPLGIEHHPAVGGEEEVKPILVQSMEIRQHLAQWLPLTLRMTNLDLLYSTDYHGRTLERFYTHVKAARHSIVLCEVLQDDQNAAPCIVGMFASQAWRVSTKVYGDGGCFLFRLKPDAACWKWQPRHGDAIDFEAEAKNNKTALLEQFMVSTRKYISMGGNPDGSSGLRLNEDLTVGESSTALGFENEALHGKDQGNNVFQVGLVEVYGLKSCLTNSD
jgi:hypothetical protein